MDAFFENKFFKLLTNEFAIFVILEDLNKIRSVFVHIIKILDSI